MANIQKIDGAKGIAYKLTAYCGYDASGKQIRKTRTWKPLPGMTARQAEKEAAYQAKLFEETTIKGISAIDGKIRFSEYSALWYENLRDIAPKTREQYGFLLVRINEGLGNIRLENMQVHHVQAFIKNLSEAGVKGTPLYTALPTFHEEVTRRNLTREGLANMAGISSKTIKAAWNEQRIQEDSARKIAAALDMSISKLFNQLESTECLSDKTIKHYYVLISTILKAAKREGIILRNVCENMKPPKVKKRETKCLDDVQARELVSLLFDEADIRIKTALLLALCSGCRRGELCGLEFGDIDAVNGVIHIRRASQYQIGAGIVTADTKTESSKRIIDMPRFIFEVLREYRCWWLEQRLMNGDKWQGEAERLFIQDNGLPISPDTINFWLDKFIQKHGIERFTPHSLRHSFISLQISQGIDIRTLQARSGHSQASTLLNTYAHAFRS